MKPLQNLIVKLMMKTVIYMMGLLCVLLIMMTFWKVYYLVTFSLKKMSMKMRTSIAWSMIQVMKTPLSPIKMLMRSPGHSWKNSVCDMNKEENNEPETFDGFIDFSVYGISKGESMDHVALGNFDMKKEHVFYPYDHSESYHAEP